MQKLRNLALAISLGIAAMASLWGIYLKTHPALQGEPDAISASGAFVVAIIAFLIAGFASDFFGTIGWYVREFATRPRRQSKPKNYV